MGDVRLWMGDRQLGELSFLLKMNDNGLLCWAVTLFSVASVHRSLMLKIFGTSALLSTLADRCPGQQPVNTIDALNTHIPGQSGRHFISFPSPSANGPVFISACPIDHLNKLSVFRFNACLWKLYPKLTLTPCPHNVRRPPCTGMYHY